MIINELLREHMDYSDQATVKRMSAILNEANHQNLFLVALTSRLYDKIQEKATRIDFSTIEQSQGDITKIQNYRSMEECITIIKKIVEQYKESTVPVDTVIDAMNNVKSRTKMWKKAFAIGSSLPVLTYNTICMSIVESISFLISVCIEYIKTPGNDTFQMSLNTVAYNRTQQNLLFETLAKFNKSCKSRELDDAMNLVMSQAIANREAADIATQVAPIAKDHPFLSDDEVSSGSLVVIHDEDEKVEKDKVQTEAGLGAILSYAGSKILLWIAKIFIPLIRQIIYYYYYHKQKISDYWADQAYLLQMNAANVMAREDLPEEKKRQIYANQMKIVERYRKRANEVSIDYTTSRKNAEKLESDESKKFKAEEVEKDYDSEQDYGYGSIFEAAITADLGVKFISAFESSLEDRIKDYSDSGIFA